jgi:hypothetical protein
MEKKNLTVDDIRKMVEILKRGQKPVDAHGYYWWLPDIWIIQFKTMTGKN